MVVRRDGFPVGDTPQIDVQCCRAIADKVIDWDRERLCYRGSKRQQWRVEPRIPIR